MKKILILTATAGEGHNQIAKSLKATFESKGAEVNVVDYYKECSNVIKTWMMDEGYKMVCKYARPVYNGFYFSLKDKKNARPEKPAIHRLKEIIDIYEPDVIIAVHIFVATNLASLKKMCDLQIPTYYVVTDYCLYPYVIDTAELDKVVIPHEALIPKFVEKGFKAEQLLPFGIPVKPEFLTSMTKEDARESLGLDRSKFTILIMTGGGGFGNIVKLLKEVTKVKQPIQVICINGKDENSFKLIDRFLKRNAIKNVLNFGFVDSVVPYMVACDCLVGKCGASTINESLNTWTPLICNEKLASQELENYEFLNNYKAVKGFEKFNDLPQVITRLIEYPEELEEIQNNLAKLRKPNAGEDLADYVLKELDK